MINIKELDEKIAERALEYYSPFYAILSDFIIVYLAILLFYVKGLGFALIILIVSAILWFLNEKGIKKVFRRPRPLYQYSLEEDVSTFSFPSTHSLISMFLAINISIAFIPIALTVGVLRIVSLRHWFSDVIIGLIAGLLIGLII